MENSRRSIVVFTCLAAVLSLTSVLLIAMAPAPLVPAATSSLFAVDAPSSLDVIFDTSVPPKSQSWKAIYIHHSRTASGNALTLARDNGVFGDHFAIGNGDGCVDGEIQIGQRWNQQMGALPPAGVSTIDPSCITICVIGDFDKTGATATQVRRLGQLVQSLQNRFNIPSSQVWLVDQTNSPAGIGRHFPIAEFRQSLLP